MEIQLGQYLVCFPDRELGTIAPLNGHALHRGAVNGRLEAFGFEIAEKLCSVYPFGGVHVFPSSLINRLSKLTSC